MFIEPGFLTGAAHVILMWGMAGDVRVPGGYGGDGAADIAVWRPGDGFWYALQSSNSQLKAVQWGNQTLGDQPVAVK